MSKLWHHTRRSQRGVAAVELAIVLPVLLILLAFPVFYGRVYFHYSTAHKAAHDAATYFSSVPLIEMKTMARVGYAVAVAQDIAATETAWLNPGPYPPSIAVQCDDGPCDGFNVPSTVRVIVRISVHDEIFGVITYPVAGDDGLLIIANVVMPYVGT